MNVNGDGFFPDSEMESSTGPTLELGWRWLAVTYTKLEYTDAADEKFDAGSVGVMFRYVWKKPMEDEVGNEVSARVGAK